MPDELVVPQPRLTREEQQEQFTRDIEIDPQEYYPEDVERPLLTKLSNPLKFSLKPAPKKDG